MSRRKPLSELTKFRPLGAKCVHCRYRPAVPCKNHPHLATKFCSTKCHHAYHSARQDALRRADAEAIRCLLGMPTGRGPQFTVREMRLLRARIERLFPDNRPKRGKVRHKASTLAGRRGQPWRGGARGDVRGTGERLPDIKL